MFKPAFFDFYLQNFDLALFCLFVSYFTTYIVIRKLIYSIYDPMFFFFLLSGAGYSVVLLLWLKGEIGDFYWFSFLTTQFLFFAFWHISAGSNKQIKKEVTFHIDRVSKVFYYLSVLLFVVCQLLAYKVTGIPLFMDSRLDAFSGGGGVGILDRFIFVSGIVSYTFAFFRVIKSTRVNIYAKVVDWFVLAFMLLTKVLSGSKAGVLDLVFFGALTLIYLRGAGGDLSLEKKINKYFIFLLLIGIPVGIFIYAVQASTGNSDSVTDGGFISFLGKFLFRFVNTGDIFYLSWVNNYIDHISSENGFTALFADFLGSSRLLDRSELPMHLGFAVFLEHTSTPNTIGPNARFNVFGLHYFGFFGAMVFSICCGGVCGFIRGRLRNLLPKNTSSLMLYVVLAYSATFIEQDPNSMFMKYLWNVILYYSSVFSLSYLIAFVAESKPKR